MDLIGNVTWLVVAYLIGSLPSGYLIAKRVRGIDIRQQGSGNIGATNVFRVVGKKWGAAVLAIDVFKGWLVTAILAQGTSAFPGLSQPLRQFLFGAATVAGHAWTPWLKMKGGKGVATSAGALLGIFPLATGLAVLVWAISLLIWRYVSLASIIAAASFPLLLLMFYLAVDSFCTVLLISLLVASFLIYNHRSNIERLRRGEEPRVKLSS